MKNRNIKLKVKLEKCIINYKPTSTYTLRAKVTESKKKEYINKKIIISGIFPDFDDYITNREVHKFLKSRDIIVEGFFTVENILRRQVPVLNVTEYSVSNSLEDFSLADFLRENIKGLGIKKSQKLTESIGNDIETAYKIANGKLTIPADIVKDSIRRDIEKFLKNLMCDNENFNDFLQAKLTTADALKLTRELEDRGIKTLNVKKRISYEESIYTYAGLIGLVNCELIIKYYNLTSLYEDLHLEEWLFQYLRDDYSVCKNLCIDIKELLAVFLPYIQTKSLLKIDHTMDDLKLKIQELLDEGVIVLHGNNLYLKGIWTMQMDSIDYIKRRITDKRELFTLDEDILKKSNYKELAPKQKEAINNTLQNKISIISGGAGTGKTYTISKLCNYLEEKDYSFKLTAFTGKASSVLSNVTGYKAYTIHKLFKFQVDKNSFFIQEEHIDDNFLIIDEASLLDLSLFSKILRNTSERTHIVLVGDKNQLLPIGAGTVFNDLLNSGKVATVILNTIFRQEEQSSIIKNSINLLNNKDVVTAPDFRIYNIGSIDECMDIIAKDYKENLEDIQFLLPSNKMTNGTLELNKKLQARLTEKQSKKNSRFNIGDKVINTRNNYSLQILNGEMGVIKDIKRKKRKQVLTIQFEGKDRPEIDIIEKEDKEAIQLGYSITTHKAQGSQWKKVYILIDTEQMFLLDKNWLYTAITRAEEEVVIFIDNTYLFNRNTKKEEQNKRKSEYIELLVQQMEQPTIIKAKGNIAILQTTEQIKQEKLRIEKEKQELEDKELEQLGFFRI